MTHVYHTDLDDSALDAAGFYFDAEAADEVCAFFPEVLRHSKGRWAGQPFELTDVQRDQIIRPLFGWKRKADGKRRYRRGSIWVPKKNFKSTMVSGLVLYMLTGDDEGGAEVYNAAVDRGNAAIVYNEALAMVRSSPALMKRIKPIPSTKTLRSKVDTSVARALSADADSAEGVNASAVFIDELHAHKNRKLFDSLYYSGSARDQPLQLSISTAGEYNPESVGWKEWSYAQRVIEDPSLDLEYFAFIAAATDEDDPSDPAVWAKANPSLGITIRHEDFESEWNRAVEDPSLMPNFLRYRLNQWVQTVDLWMRMDRWKECGGDGAARPWDIGAQWWGGMDLSSKIDITAWVLLWFDEERGKWCCRGHYFMPADNIRKAELRDRAPYSQWAKEGWITLTPGDVVDQDAIKALILEDVAKGNHQSTGFDPYNATKLATELMTEGVEIFEVRQGARSMSEPMKKIKELAMQHEIDHGGDPMMAWMMGNVVADTDANENIRPTKKRSTGRIDGPVALINAMARAMSGEEEVVEYRGM